MQYNCISICIHGFRIFMLSNDESIFLFVLIFKIILRYQCPRPMILFFHFYPSSFVLFSEFFLFKCIYIKQGIEKKSNKQVAIKHITTYVKKYVDREVDCMSRMDHENIAKFLGFENDTKIGHILVMDYTTKH